MKNNIIGSSCRYHFSRLKSANNFLQSFSKVFGDVQISTCNLKTEKYSSFKTSSNIQSRSYSSVILPGY